MTKLVVNKTFEAGRLEPDDDRPPIGSWWWVTDDDEAEETDDAIETAKKYDRPGRKWLACVIELGSNYAKVEGVKWIERIAFDNFHKRCASANELDEAGIPEFQVFIQGKLDEHKGNVRELMGEIKRVCHQLGVPIRQALAEAESASQALATTHGVEDVKRYQKALVKAKEKTLPELFEKVKAEHELMATWMKADLIPAKAELAQMEKVTDAIEGKIHTVELYAGLQEELVQVREGNPAKIDEKVHVMQRRAYMDEECLVQYEAGGMDFKSVGKFDKWLSRDANFRRILPHERCIIAFKIRRYAKEYSETGIGTLSDFIKFQFYNKYNEKTFLYIRNGNQLWRMMTDIDFDEELFPMREDNELLGDHELWIEKDGAKTITAHRRAEQIEEHKTLRSYCAQVLWQWHRAGCPTGDTEWKYVLVDNEHESLRFDGQERKVGETRIVRHGDPRRYPFGLIDNEYSNARSKQCYVEKNYVPFTPLHIYYDDVQRKIAKATLEHNRVAVVVQGLLDRSTCLHPHPPWKIWTAEGFEAGIQLVYDISRALTPGEAPDFEAYRKQLNKSIKVGSHTIGQYKLWKAEVGSRREYKWYPSKYDRDGEGPDPIDVVKSMRGGQCTFTFVRERQRAKWVNHPTKKGYLQKQWGDIEMKWSCLPDELFCVDAYTPGDFHMFYDDPRTRADYIEWAPFMLAAEDWHKLRRESGSVDEAKPEPEEEDDDDDEADD